jgi:tripartite-type tricarboxylate transporter receptor subunit TctC
MNLKRRCLLSLLSLAALGAHAQENYPNKAIRIVVPIGAGGVADSGARIVARQLAEELKQPVIVENRPGGAQVVGTAAVATAAADGYTLLWTTGGIAAAPVVVKSVPFDPFKDFEPITLGGRSNVALVGSASLPEASIAALLAQTKAQPGKLNYGTTGGSVTLIFEHFKQVTQADLTAVAYKSTPNAWADLMGGQIQLLMEAPAAAKAQASSGKAKILAVSGAQRSPDLPDVPTVSEQGFPNFSLYTWQGMFMRAGTPADRVATVKSAMAKVMANPEVRQQFLKLGVEPIGSSSAELAALMQKDLQLWRAVAAKAGISPE